jgi:hypothetical protein
LCKVKENKKKKNQKGNKRKRKRKRKERKEKKRKEERWKRRGDSCCSSAFFPTVRDFVCVQAHVSSTV